jgi:hypothetical protein
MDTYKRILFIVNSINLNDAEQVDDASRWIAMHGPDGGGELTSEQEIYLVHLLESRRKNYNNQ